MAAVGRDSPGALFARGNTSSVGGDVQTRVEEWGRQRMNQMFSLAERDQLSRGGKRDCQHWENKGHGG